MLTHFVVHIPKNATLPLAEVTCGLNTKNGAADVSIIALSRWAANKKDVERLGRTVKPILERHGVQLEIGQIFSGTNAGEFMVKLQYTDWERFGRAMYAISNDTKYQEALTEAFQLGELRERSIIMTLDLADTRKNSANILEGTEMSHSEALPMNL